MKIWAFLLLSMLAGTTSKSLIKRIYNGRVCDVNERLYHVYIVNAVGEMCGGSLLSPSWVITAAHCRGNIPGDLTLDFIITTPRSVHILQQRVVPVANQSVFSNPRGDHDIMLLRLNPVINNYYTIPLPPNGCHRPALGAEIHMAGWGPLNKPVTPNTPRPTHLQCAEMYIVDCSPLPSVANSTYHRDLHNIICYSRQNVDICPGDSGGGVEYDGHLYGVHVTSGKNVCKNNADAVDVCYQPIRTWIRNTMAHP